VPQCATSAPRARGSESQRRAQGHHRCSAGVDGLDDLGVVDALEVPSGSASCQTGNIPSARRYPAPAADGRGSPGADQAAHAQAGPGPEVGRSHVAHGGAGQAMSSLSPFRPERS
jgi:hypothetical protein